VPPGDVDAVSARHPYCCSALIFLATRCKLVRAAELLQLHRHHY
jgi:hypothetical protein